MPSKTKRNAVFAVELGRNAGAVYRGSGETAVGVRRTGRFIFFVEFIFVPRLALGKNEGWMAEHMLILGVKFPDGTKKFPKALRHFAPTRVIMFIFKTT